MRVWLKRLADQVIVITGASSGIGLVTAKMAAERGARVLLVARNASDLTRAVEEIRRQGGRAVHTVADVANPDQVEGIAETAVREFGRIDTWVNNAAVAVYGRLMDLTLPDMRRQFDVNYWGQVNGSRVAVPYLKRQGGALINVASALADRAIPLQGNYCAAKHALKAFTDALRMELEEEAAPISVTLIKPGSIDTPLFEKAKTLLGVEPQPVPPVYAPELVARAILESAERPIRDVIVSGMGKVLSVAGTMAPRTTDRYMERTTFNAQKSDQPLVPGRRDNLYEPVTHDGGERGRTWTGRVHGRSLYTAAALHRKAAAGVAVTLLAATVAAAAIRNRRT
ncbi:MAG TPA: SDR family oxidoreductase [Gemmatimonadales bacterium]|jgi:NAD(P)-dependent dehydrogenase (short-subunit alcohol dehydrogenase family)|nr:SDR family oxidoreductase [Gemmatimonadales bacterium]